MENEDLFYENDEFKLIPQSTESSKLLYPKYVVGIDIYGNIEASSYSNYSLGIRGKDGVYEYYVNKPTWEEFVEEVNKTCKYFKIVEPK